MISHPTRIRASARIAGQIKLASQAVQVRAADKGPRRFTIAVYTGEPMYVSGFDEPLILDLSDIDLSAQSLPAIYEHTPAITAIVGQVQRLTVKGAGGTPPLVAEGIFTPDPSDPEDVARIVLAKADAGFEWQASIGADATAYDRYSAGETVSVNGRDYAGPCVVARGVIPREVSFVVLGADRRTSVVVASSPSRSFNVPRPSTASRPALLSARVFEVALAIRAGVDPKHLDRDYGQQTINQAMSREARSAASLSYLLNAVIVAAGGSPQYGPVSDSTIRAAFEADRLIRASDAASTYSLSGILSNVANKSLLASYLAVDQSALAIAAKGYAQDFKQITRHRITAEGQFEKLGANGEIKHGRLSEETYTSQVDTWAKGLGVTRKDFINDDLGAFQRIGQLLGRNGALTLQYELFKTILANVGSFFGVGNGNLNTGAGSALSIAGLSIAEQKFHEQSDGGGLPVMIGPKFLLTPPALAVYAKQLCHDLLVNETTTANSPKPSGNPHTGKFTPLVSPFLAASLGLPGGSDTKWWLFGDPADVPAVEISYLFGQETPTIESSEADFDTLGVRFRGFFDFGIGLQDWRAAQQNNGS